MKEKVKNEAIDYITYIIGIVIVATSQYIAGIEATDPIVLAVIGVLAITLSEIGSKYAMNKEKERKYEDGLQEKAEPQQEEPEEMEGVA